MGLPGGMEFFLSTKHTRSGIAHHLRNFTKVSYDRRFQAIDWGVRYRRRRGCRCRDEGWVGPMRRRLRDPRALHGVAVAFALAIAATIAACGAITSGPERTGDVFDKVRAVDLLPRYPQ